MVEFVSPEYTVAEDGGEVDVCLMIDHTISSPVTVRLYAFPDTAEGMKDYSCFSWQMRRHITIKYLYYKKDGVCNNYKSTHSY